MRLRIRFYFKGGLRHDVYIVYWLFREKVMPNFLLETRGCSFSKSELDHLVERLEAIDYLVKVYDSELILAIAMFA